MYVFTIAKKWKELKGPSLMNGYAKCGEYPFNGMLFSYKME